MIDINVQMMNLPIKTKALTTINFDGSYTIILNSRLSYEQQKLCYLHELKHILGNDFYAYNVDIIEHIAHNQ